MSTKVGLHPAAVPTIALISLLATCNVPAPLLDSLLNLSLTTIYEQVYPPTLKHWLARIATLQPQPSAIKTAADIEETVRILIRGGLDTSNGWLNDLKSLCPWSDEEESSVSSTPLHRSSPLALYLRRFRMTFGKLSFDEAVAWWEDVSRWVDGTWVEPDQRTQRRVVADSYARAKAAQDYQATKDASSFYDLDDTTGSHGKPQYALLNTAFVEFENEGWQTSREALAEAVQVARNAGDSRCLAAASSLYKRLEAVAPAASTSTSSPNDLVLGEGRPSPTDLLWEVKHDSGTGFPVPSLFPRLYSSRVLHQCPPLSTNTKDKGRAVLWNDAAWEPSWHAVAANLWEDLGSSTLSKLRHELALEALDEDRNLWNVQLAVLSRQAFKLARSNRAEQALALLLRAVDTRAKRRTFGMLELRAWEAAVLEVSRISAELRGHDEVVERLARLAPPSVPHWTGLPTAEDGSTTDSIASTSELYNTARRLLDEGHGVIALPYAVRALHTSTINSYEPLRLRCVCQVAQCRLAISPTAEEASRGLQELESVWGDVLSRATDDVELMALACEVRGRALVFNAGGKDEEMLQALPLLSKARSLYGSLAMHCSSQRVLAMLARLCDHLSTSTLPPPRPETSWTAERDSLAKEHLEGAAEQRVRATIEPQLLEVVERVKRAVGAKFASAGDG